MTTTTIQVSIRQKIRDRLAKAGKSPADVNTILRHHDLVQQLGLEIILARKRKA